MVTLIRGLLDFWASIRCRKEGHIARTRSVIIPLQKMMKGTQGYPPKNPIDIYKEHNISGKPGLNISRISSMYSNQIKFFDQLKCFRPGLIKKTRKEL